MFSNKSLIGILFIGMLFAACSESTTINTPSLEADSPNIVEQGININNSSENLRGFSLDDIQSMEDINEELADRGANVRIAYAETVTPGHGAEATGQTIVANDRNKRLDAQWVPGDERRNADGNNLTYLIDQTWMPANFNTGNEVDGNDAIDASLYLELR